MICLKFACPTSLRAKSKDKSLKKSVAIREFVPAFICWYHSGSDALFFASKQLKTIVIVVSQNVKSYSILMS